MNLPITGAYPPPLPPSIGPSAPGVTTTNSSDVVPTNQLGRVSRSLCGAVYFDDRFQAAVLDLVAPKWRAVARAPGVDISRVVVHAVGALKQWRTRDLTLLGSLLVGGLLAFASGGLPLVVLNVVFAMIVGFAAKKIAQPKWRGAKILLSVVAVGLWLTLLSELDAGGASGSLRPLLPTFFVPWLTKSSFILIAILGVNLWHLVHVEKSVLEPLVKGTEPAVSTPTSPRLIRLIDDAKDSGGDSDLIVASGYSPFVGTGKVVNAWGIAAGISKSTDDAAPPRKFTEIELSAYVTARLAISGLVGAGARDVYLVDGRDCERLNLFPSDPSPAPLRRPVRSFHSGATADHGFTDDPERLRRYTQVEVASWDGDVVASAYLRSSLTEEILYLEAHYCVLGPIDERLDLFDRPAPTGLQRSISLVAESFRLGIHVSTIWRRWTSEWRWQRADREAVLAIKSGNTLDHGSSVSVRDLATGKFTRYFQSSDAKRFERSVDRSMFEAIADFLSEHNIDSPEFTLQSQSIVQNNVINGGTFTGPVAQGRKAKATQQTTTLS
jgi:hypothetical protein